MAPNKRKILEAARKHAQKGAKDRALKEYEKLLKLDPRDAKLRLEIGDAYRRWGQLGDAITTYTRVAEQYMAEGFDARAVAVFKQIHNLDPECWPTYEPLAELYQRMGLASEASSALQTAAEGYQRAGKRHEALGLLRRMAAIDPTNTTSRLKVADLLRQEGLSGEAVAEYDGVAEEFERQGELEQAAAALARILELEPDHVSALARASSALIALGQLERAEPVARRLLDAEPDVPEHYERLADVYRQGGREDDLGVVYRRLAELYRRRGDEDRAREITQRFVPPDALAVSDGDLDEAPCGEPGGGMKGDLSEFLADDHDFGSEPLLDEDLLDPEPPAAFGPVAPLAEETVLQGSESTASPLPVDPEQLLAEACVYLRYDKLTQAVENLEAILAAEPRNRRALEKLGEALAETDSEGAVEAWLHAAGIAQEEGDAEALQLLRDRIAALDQSAVSTLECVESEESQRDELDLAEDEEYLEISDPVAPAGPDVSLEEGHGDLDASHVSLDDVPGDSEPSGVSLDHDPEDLEPSQVSLDIPGDLESSEFSLDGAQADLDIEIELDDEPPQGDVPPAAAASEPSGEAAADPSASSSTSQQVLEELEEAEFYLQQGMLDEAERIYERLRGIAPNHPQVLVRLGELAAARGDDPGETATGLDPNAAHAGPADRIEASEAESTVPDDIPDDLSDWSHDFPESATEAPAGSLDAAVPPAAELTGEITSELSASGIGEIDPGDTGTLPPVPEETVESLELERSEAANGGFDLAAEIHSALDEDDGSASGNGSTDGFAAVFREFKQGVSQTLAAGDHEAHYDLGIAYREMGLFDDALAEFRAAMASPERRIDALHMMGQCALELGQADQAVAHLELVLATGALSDEQQLPVRYDLGRAFERVGDLHRAREAWDLVVAVEPSFADVEERLARLGDEKPEQPPELVGDFESFEDVVEEAIREDPRVPESASRGMDFDDLVEEMNADAEPTLAAARQPGSGSAAADRSEELPRPRKRKKISFV